jgi:hypothetical protein
VQLDFNNVELTVVIDTIAQLPPLFEHDPSALDPDHLGLALELVVDPHDQRLAGLAILHGGPGQCRVAGGSGSEQRERQLRRLEVLRHLLDGGCRGGEQRGVEQVAREDDVVAAPAPLGPGVRRRRGECGAGGGSEQGREHGVRRVRNEQAAQREEERVRDQAEVSGHRTRPATMGCQTGGSYTSTRPANGDLLAIPRS